MVFQSFCHLFQKKETEKQDRRVGRKGRRVGPPKGGPRRVEGPKFRAFFFLSRHHFALFVSLWTVFSWFFGGVLEAPGRQMCTFGVLGPSCEAPAALQDLANIMKVHFGRTLTISCPVQPPIRDESRHLLRDVHHPFLWSPVFSEPPSTPASPATPGLIGLGSKPRDLSELPLPFRCCLFPNVA